MPLLLLVPFFLSIPVNLLPQTAVYHSHIMHPRLTSLTILTLPALLLLAPLPASAKKKPALPEVFSTAQTIFVEYKDGDITNLNLDRDQRDTILNVQDAIQDWGRYSLARSRRSADMVLVVFKGRLDNRPLSSPLPGTTRTSPGARSPLADPSQAGNSTLNDCNDPSSPTATSNPNDPDCRFSRQKDEIRVYTLKPDGKYAGLLWSSSQQDGLNPPTLQLFRQLKNAVESSYPPPPRQP